MMKFSFLEVCGISSLRFCHKKIKLGIIELVVISKHILLDKHCKSGFHLQTKSHFGYFPFPIRMVYLFFLNATKLHLDELTKFRYL